MNYAPEIEEDVVMKMMRKMMALVLAAGMVFIVLSDVITQMRLSFIVNGRVV